MATKERWQLKVSGVVQGVGFRPFVYRLATEELLAGWIGNDTEGVTIELEGSPASLARFNERLGSELPPLARLDSVACSLLPLMHDQHFRIIASQIHGAVATGIPADAATCSDCRRELFDQSDRRFRYPFLNCTHCGPRFTITRRIPYDRPQTSMALFPMCAACRREYEDPLDRRFHAQPIACPVCGPHLWMTDGDGHELACADVIATTARRLLRGEIAAIKGIGGFHLVVDATNAAAVRLLRERKQRFGKPLAVMLPSLAAARALCLLSPIEEQMLCSPAHPIVLCRMRPASCIAPQVAPHLPWLGVFLPYAPLHHLLLAEEGIRALVMTSANLSEEPICIDNDEALARLGAIADFFLLHNRQILERCDDSVVAEVDHAPQLIRRARGYVPLGVPLPVPAPPLLAVGGHLKNVFTLASGAHAYQSQHLGDLESPSALGFFGESLEHLMRTFEIEPQFVVHDMHPGYLSTNWAREFATERGLELIPVQHHHAHLAATIAEHRLSGPTLGLALDGTGYGTDGSLWGGELLLAEMDGSFRRLAHLAPVAMPGGDAAIRAPWRMALAHLLAAGVSLDRAASMAGCSSKEAELAARMIERRVNAPLTSSLGRLFDAVAAILLQRSRVEYEAQAAIELEAAAIDAPLDSASEALVQIIDKPAGQRLLIDPAQLLLALLDGRQAGQPLAVLAARFHAEVVSGFTRAAALAGTKSGIAQIVLSGGCLHNRRLAALLRLQLEAAGFSVYLPRLVSPGDGGLSYGQAALAAQILAHRCAR